MEPTILVWHPASALKEGELDLYMDRRTKSLRADQIMFSTETVEIKTTQAR